MLSKFLRSQPISILALTIAIILGFEEHIQCSYYSSPDVGANLPIRNTL